MYKLTQITSKLGYIDVFTNQDKTKLYTIPYGYIGPNLVKKDLEFLLDFDKNSKSEWTYLVDTSKVNIVNPINPFLLRKLKQLSNMNEYVVYAPSPIVRLMLKLTNWINKPDRIIKENDMLQLELN